MGVIAPKRLQARAIRPRSSGARVRALLLAVPNVSEGRDLEVIAAIGAAYEGAGARVLDTHSDPDHNRSVHTLAGEPQALAQAVTAGAQEAIARIDLRVHEGQHPRVGAIDVAPVVFRDAGERGAACAEALVLADRLGELGLPVYLYGELAGGRTRADLRRGGTETAKPDFGPPAHHPTAGAVLVAARPPLIAFNAELKPPATIEDARRIAALIRESGAEGLPGVRAIGVELESRHEVAQVSMNIEEPGSGILARVLEAISGHAPVAECELVGLAPAAAFDGWPDDMPVRNRRTVDDALAMNVVRRYFDTYAAGDFPAMWQCFAEDVEVRSDPQFPGGGVFRGHDEVRAFFESFDDTWAVHPRLEARALEVLNGRVVVDTAAHLHGEGMGVEVTMPWTAVIEVREGRIARMEFFQHRDQALKSIDGS